MSVEQAKVIVAGSLSVDMVMQDLPHLPEAGEHVQGRLSIRAGGKGHNMAVMAAGLMAPGSVAVLAHTANDKFGLGRIPVDSLARHGVNCDYVQISESDERPRVALLGVDTEGGHIGMVDRGSSDLFSPEDVDRAEALFRGVAQAAGRLVLSFGCPMPTVRRAAELAKQVGLEVLMDPGGGKLEWGEIGDLFEGVRLLKPNEHEAEMLTGVRVRDFDSAEIAARRLQGRGVQNVLVTVGAGGAYLFSPSDSLRIVAPPVPPGERPDGEGCGDQVMATLCAGLDQGKPLDAAARMAVLAGTLQFYKQGLQPVTRQELADAAERYL